VGCTWALPVGLTLCTGAPEHLDQPLRVEETLEIKKIDEDFFE